MECCFWSTFFTMIALSHSLSNMHSTTEESITVRTAFSHHALSRYEMTQCRTKEKT